MSPALVKLVAVVVLIAQAAIGYAPGRVVCVLVRDCGIHEAGAASSGQCDADGCSAGASGHEERPSRGHDPFDPVVVPVDPCACHVHVPMPSDERTPTHPRAAFDELKTLPVSPAFAPGAEREHLPFRPVVARAHPPDFSRTGQVLALKATRLLI